MISLAHRRFKVITKQCKSCKLTIYPGYSENHKEKIRFYDDDWKNYTIFFSTYCTAISIDFLNRFVALKQKCHTTFHGRTNAYNYQHNYLETDEKKMDHRRLTEAYFKFIFLLFKERYNLPLKLDGNIYEALQSEYNILYEAFHNKFALHVCQIEGCKTCLVVDGHMKAHRKLCKMKGCFKDPILKSVYCDEHSYKEAHTVNTDNKQDLLHEDEYHVEKIIRKLWKKNKDEWMYEVKWKGYQDTTLEPKENLPRVLVELFEIYGDSSISTDIDGYFEKGGIKYVKIKVQQSDLLQLPACAMEVNEDAYFLPSSEHACNTEKTKISKRFHHRTGGILVMGKPCGILVHVNEIFGAESITSVAEMIEKSLQMMSTDIKLIVYRCMYLRMPWYLKMP